MKHAYLIIVHNELNLLSNLISLLDDERNDIYIHYDAKLEEIPNLSAEKSHLYVVEKRINAHWADFSLVEVEFELLQMAYSNKHYDFYHFLSGVDMPLKTQNQIHDFFDKNRGKEFIDYCLSDVSDEMDRKMKRWHLFPHNFKNTGHWSYLFRIIRAIFIRLQIVAGFRRNRNIDFKKGSQWVSITSDFTKHLLSRRVVIRRIYTHTFCPDEAVMQTECWNSPFRNKLYSYSGDYRGYMRLIDWKRGRPYIWRDEDYEELLSSNCLFARKFSSDHIGIVEKLIQAVNQKK